MPVRRGGVLGGHDRWVEAHHAVSADSSGAEAGGEHPEGFGDHAVPHRVVERERDAADQVLPVRSMLKYNRSGEMPARPIRSITMVLLA